MLQTLRKLEVSLEPTGRVKTSTHLTIPHNMTLQLTNQMLKLLLISKLSNKTRFLKMSSVKVMNIQSMSIEKEKMKTRTTVRTSRPQSSIRPTLGQSCLTARQEESSS